MPARPTSSENPPSSNPHPSAPRQNAPWADWDREFLWHPFTPMKPWCEEKQILVIDRGEAEFLIDTTGRRYIDGVSSLWCNIHGHCVPELDSAVREQLSKIAHTTLLGLTNPPAAELGKRLIEMARSSGVMMDRVFYSDDGSTAVEVACKMAYQYWRNVGSADTAGAQGVEAVGLGEKNRSRFIALEAAYHGDTVGAVSVGGIPAFHQAFRGLCFPVDFAPSPDRGDAGAACLAQIAALLDRSPALYAAIIMEPLIQAAGGMIFHPPGFLKKLRELTLKRNILLIADEVMTGFGRTGTMLACQHENVTPDLLCLSKGLTAGYMPLGATLATRRIFDAFYADPRAGRTFYHGHTFTGHPLACAAAIASLDLFEKKAVLEHVGRLEPVLSACMAAARGRRFVKDVRCRGLVGAIDLAWDSAEQPPFPPHWRIGGEVCTRMRDLGLMMRPLADTLVIMPPLAIREENLRRLCDGVIESLSWIPDIVARKTREDPP